jgi:hypothetical protein
VTGDGNAVVTVTAALKPWIGLMAHGVHYAPTTFPQVVGLDGVGRLPDGARVAFLQTAVGVSSSCPDGHRRAA